MRFAANLSKLFTANVDNLFIDITTGKLAVAVTVGSAKNLVSFVPNAEGEGYSLQSNPITDMGFNVPGIAIRTPISQIKRGDVVVSEANGYARFVVGVDAEKGQLRVALPGKGTEEIINAHSTPIFGQSEPSFLKVLNTFDGVGSAFGQGNTNPLLMLALLGDDKGGGNGGGLSDILPLILLSQGQGGDAAGSLQQMLPLLLLSRR